MSNHDLSRDPEHTDTVDALEDYGATISYPPIPDIASAVRAHLSRDARERSVSVPPWSGRAEAKTATITLPSASLGGQSPTPALDRTAHQWPCQIAKLVAVTAALAVVGLALFLTFDVLAPDSDQSGSLPGGAPEGSSNLLYVIAANGVITALDMTDDSVAFAISTSSSAEFTNPDPDAAISPDGEVLYAIADDSLFAIEIASRTELWRTPLPRGERLRYIGGGGPSTLAVSPDGRTLYLYSSHAPELFYVRILDARTGAFIAESATIRQRCAADMHVSPDGSTLYAVCIRFGTIAAIDLDTLEVLPIELIESGPIAGAVASPDGRLIVVASDIDSYRAVVLDMNERHVEQQVQLGGPPLPAVLHQLVALSRDGRTLYVTLGEDDHDGDTGTQNTRRVVVFDTSTWQQTNELFVEPEIGGRGLIVDAQGQLYGVSNSARPNAPEGYTSDLWMLDTATGELHIVLERSDWEIAPDLLLINAPQQ